MHLHQDDGKCRDRYINSNEQLLPNSPVLCLPCIEQTCLRRRNCLIYLEMAGPLQSLFSQQFLVKLFLISFMGRLDWIHPISCGSVGFQWTNHNHRARRCVLLEVRSYSHPSRLICEQQPLPIAGCVFTSVFLHLAICKT